MLYSDVDDESRAANIADPACVYVYVRMCVDVWICGDGDNCTSIHIYKYIIIYIIILNTFIFEYYKNRQRGVKKKEKATRDRSRKVYDGVSRRAGGVSGVIGGYRVCRRRRPARAREH